MKRKILVIAASICIVFTCTPNIGGIAFAGTVKEPQPVTGVQQEHKCGYEPAKSIQKSTQVIQSRDELKRCKPNKNIRALRRAKANHADSEFRFGKDYLIENNTNHENDIVLLLYERIANGIHEQQVIIELSYDEDEFNPTLDEVDKAYSLVKEDYPEYFWLDNTWWYYTYTYKDDPNQTKYVSEIEPSYLFSNNTEFTMAQEEFDKEINEIITQMDEELGTEASDYDKELWIHDYLILTNDYISYSDYAHSAYGAIVEGEAVCEGYTRAFQLILNMLGIENCTVTGSDSIDADAKENHIWNAVKLGDDWYQVDITWDDMGNEPKDIYHAYFNITTAHMQRDHTIMGNEFDVPECKGEEYFYFNRNRDHVFMTDSENFDEQRFIQFVAGQIKTNGVAKVYCPTDIGETKELGAKFLSESILTSIMDELNLESFCGGYYYNGDTEYHLINAESKNRTVFQGQIVLGRADLSGLKIRLYASDEVLGVTDDTRSAVIEEAINKHRKDDNLHIAAAEKSIAGLDDDWWCDWRDDKTGAKQDTGCVYTHFRFDEIPPGEYNLAISKEGYGLWIYGIEIEEQDIEVDDDEDTDNWHPIYTLGDLDDNTWVDSSDILFMKRYIAGWEKYVATGNWYAADINNDGEVSIIDATILQRYLAGWKGYENLEDYESGDKKIEDVA